MAVDPREAKQNHQSFEYFNPVEYRKKIFTAADYVKEQLPSGFIPRGILTLGSGGLGSVANVIKRVATIPFKNIPGFPVTTVFGHEGNLVTGYLEGFPVIGQQGRIHYYEKGGEPNQVIALKEVTFPVYVERALGAEFLIATNAAGGLNSKFRPGDLMIIGAHNDLHFPNPLAGPQVDLFDAWRFQPQHNEYNQRFRRLFHQAARNVNEAGRVHEGVYAAVTGPTFESAPDSRQLRVEGIDAIGMSTVPEVIVATNIGMETGGFSLIANVVRPDGENPTSHDEVMAALRDPATMKRATNVTSEFFRLLGKEYQPHLFLH